MLNTKIGRPLSDEPAPFEFRIYAAIEGDLKLRARYCCGRAKILRWRRKW
jgi:hypothetical protein